MNRPAANIIAGLDAWSDWLAVRSPLRAHSFVMMVLFAGALIVGYVLLPGEGERIAMLERDGKTREARAILEAGFANGDRRQRTLFQLQGLYEAAGNLPKSRQMLELLAQRRPRDLATQRQLGLFYKQTQDEAAYVRSLIQQIDIRYSESACREVIGLLRRSGQAGEEQAMLQRCRQKGYRRPDDMVRLASLLAVDGDIREASILLRAVDDLRRLKTDRERLQLFALLLEIDQPNEAQRRAARWVKGVKDDNLALTLIHELVAANRHDLAIELARETSVPGDSVFLAVAEIMVERSELLAARAILQGWLDKAVQFDGGVAGRFVAAALAAGAPELALAGAQRIGLARLETDTIADLARGLDDAGRRADAEALRSAAGIPAQSGARIAVRDRPRPAGIFRIATLDAWRASLWKRVADENRPGALTAAGKDGRPVSDLRALKALKQAKRLTTYRRRPTPGAVKPADPGGFNFFSNKPE